MGINNSETELAFYIGQRTKLKLKAKNVLDLLKLPSEEKLEIDLHWSLPPKRGGY